MRDLRKAPRRYSRLRLTLFATLRAAARALGARALYARWLGRRGLQLVRVDVPVPGLPADLDGLRIVQLSDLHAGPFFDADSLAPVVDLVRAARPDVLVLTGDFITDVTDDAFRLGDAFARMPAPSGRFAVFGNHDYRGRREGELAAWLRRQGVRALRNESALVVRGTGRLRVVGLEDIEEGRLADLDAALAGCDPDDHASVLLCHHPDVVGRLPPGRFELVLSGHTHGGQVVLPLLGCPARGRLPDLLAGSRDLDGGGLQHVNRGLGVLVLPLRIGARPEVTCLTLRAVP